MGSSPSATLVWGVVLSEDPKFGGLSEATADKLGALEDNDYDFAGVFGFTLRLEPSPERADGETHQEWRASDRFQAWERYRDEWAARRDRAIPVEILYVYGYDAECPRILGLRRTKVVADETQEDITGVVFTHPEDFEVAAVNRFLDAIGFTGDREIRLYLVPFYG